MRIGYVVKRYPRYSETFIVNEILAHERAGTAVDIFPVRPTVDTHFQNRISQVRGTVHYLPTVSPKTQKLWDAMAAAHRAFPAFSRLIADALHEEEPLNLYQAIQLAFEIRTLGIDHLHAHFATVATTVARLAAKLAGVTYTFTAHAKDIFHETVDSDDVGRKLRDAAGTVTVSDYNLSYLRKHWGSDAVRVRRIYNGLYLPDFPLRPFGERRPKILAVGRLVEKKGIEVLVEACARLANSEQDFHCTIVGAGNQESLLNARIRELDLIGRVELCGLRPPADIIDLVHDSSVFVAPSVTAGDGDQDGMPTVLLEAMALGTPCVGTDVIGIPEAIRDGVTGLFVPQRDAQALAATIGRLLNDAPLQRELARNARGMMESEFDVDTSTEKMRQLFSAAITTRLENTPKESCEAIECE